MKHHHCHGHECHSEEHDSHGSCSSCCHEHAHEHAYHEDHTDFAQQLIELADEAWMDVLKDKIRKHVEASSGKHLDELAKLVAETNNNRWKMKMQNDNACHEFKQHVSDFFHKK